MRKEETIVDRVQRKADEHECRDDTELNDSLDLLKRFKVRGRKPFIWAAFKLIHYGEHYYIELV